MFRVGISVNVIGVSVSIAVCLGVSVSVDLCLRLHIGPSMLQ